MFNKPSGANNIVRTTTTLCAGLVSGILISGFYNSPKNGYSAQQLQPNIATSQPTVLTYFELMARASELDYENETVTVQGKIRCQPDGTCVMSNSSVLQVLRNEAHEGNGDELLKRCVKNDCHLQITGEISSDPFEPTITVDHVDRWE
jgi:hypothetical protein